ncbi:hypothetical protein ZIOFF_014229 [Zingiber officinale]|uniref:Glycine cleavage system H protein n=1 Tax=Zingiber officinale TaxID=94328 RepID=A0A8J5LDJ7_ZINOF|nr:hypothetical protein ZIOFF_014229 [Zingiber officinale]
MASRLLWASRAASYLKISTCPSAFSIGTHFKNVHDSNYLLTVIKDLKYANTHEWVKVDGSTATIGITDHAQVNASPFEDGWIVKLKSSTDGEVNSLMDYEQYSKFYEEEDAKH